MSNSQLKSFDSTGLKLFTKRFIISSYLKNKSKTRLVIQRPLSLLTRLIWHKTYWNNPSMICIPDIQEYKIPWNSENNIQKIRRRNRLNRVQYFMAQHLQSDFSIQAFLWIHYSANLKSEMWHSGNGSLLILL